MDSSALFWKLTVEGKVPVSHIAGGKSSKFVVRPGPVLGK